MRLLCGADLAEKDVEAIRQGHETLEAGVTRRMMMRLALPESDYVENRLKALAWLVGTGQLEIKVVLPTDAHGNPLPASKSESYYHPKEGLFEDAEGNQVGFSGSVNESATALEDNYESFMVFNSWESAPYLSNIRIKFDRLWSGSEEDWIAMPVPEAVKQELLKFRPSRPLKEFGIEEPEEKKEEEVVDVTVDADQLERIIFQFLRDVPRLLNADRLGMGGRWGVDGNFLAYFDELRQPFEEIDWRFVLSMLDDYFATGGEWDERFCRVAEERVGPVTWDQLRRLHRSASPESVIRQLDGPGQGVLRELATRHTPLRRHVFRNTRPLLREYRRQGLLKENVPWRDPRPEWIEMKPEESVLYDRIEEYIRDHYQKYEAERKGLGFIMTVYRRRLTSSFYAIQKSLERRLAFLKGETEAELLTDDDLDQEDLDADVTELLPFAEEVTEAGAEVPGIFQGEIEYVEDFLADLQALGTDSKFEQLTRDLNDILKRRESVIVFTQYTDTMDYLRDKLRQVYGSQVACYSGRGGERWDGSAWVRTSKEIIKKAFRDREEIKILLGTESASEGLNLQTCGVLINYEMPWNPMRVEQRIGRIDRIGQVYDRVWVRNYFYDGTVEATVYQRLDDRISSFESVVGELQPILSEVARVIEAAAMAHDTKRGELIAREIEEINRRVRSEEISSLNLDSLVDDSVEAAAEEPAPVTLPELERTIVKSRAFRDRIEPHPDIAGAHLFDWHGSYQAITFDPDLFDKHPNTLTLMTFGGGLLEQVLEAVDPPADHTARGKLVRCAMAEPLAFVGYYGVGDGGPVRCLSELRGALADSKIANLTGEMKQDLAGRFAESTKAMLARETRAAESRHNALISSLTEEIRQLLAQAAYVELAQAANRDLFDDFLPLDFSEQAYERLKRHKVPFAGALRVVNTGLPKLAQDNPFYVRMRDSKRDVLTKRFDLVRTRLGDRLRHLMQAKRAGGIGEVLSSPSPTIVCYSATSAAVSAKD